VRRRLLLSYLSLTVFVLAVLELPLAINEAHTERQALTGKVQRDASAIAGVAQAPGAGSLAPARVLRLVATRYQAETGARVVITGRGGRRLVQVGPALATGNGAVLSQAMPIGAGGRVLGAVRISYPTSRVSAHIHRYWLLLGGIAFLVLTTALAIGLVLARWVARPLLALGEAARRVGHGDLGARAPVGSGPVEVEAVAAAFNTTTAHLERMVTAQREFVADASHQLRSPLTALRLRLENLEPALASGGRAGLEGALAEVERLSEMVDGLLVLARAEHASAAPAAQDAGALVATRLAAWTQIAGERGVVLCDASGGAAVSVLASPGHLEQVLDNLIENALAFAPQASTVAVWCRAHAGAVEFGVSDQGPGITLEGRARAFDRFWTAGPAHGTGLGLAVVRRLVEADGGTVSLQDAPGGGLEAIVRLPASAEPQLAPAFAPRVRAVA
jgi:signal transduction histidine kinase